MPRYGYERLTAQDTSFLLAERSTVPMHVAAVQLLEAGDLATADGGIDIRRYKRAVESVLHLIPRYRQKLRRIPLQRRSVWIDDRHFSLDYHIRHSCLPKPGGIDQLKALAARIMTRPLDRSRPLWEIWLVEGLEGGRFALVSKIHHCMIDGVAGAELAQILMSPTPECRLEEPVPYLPRPAPGGPELAAAELRRRAALPVAVLRAARELAAGREAPRAELRARSRALVDLAALAVKAAPETPLNGRLGPHRLVDWTSFALDDVRAVRRLLGCTVNDVVLAVVAGAVREYLIRRRVDPAGIGFRISAPVSLRGEEERGRMGNRVSSWILGLPIGEADPRVRVEVLSRRTRELKESRQALGIDTLMQAADHLPLVLLALATRAASGPINAIVTNVPGPEFPLYLLGARLLETFPMVPLLENTGLGIALLSYDGRLCWGFNADSELVPDLPVFVELVRGAFEELRSAASLQRLQVESHEEPAPPPQRRRPRRSAA